VTKLVYLFTKFIYVKKCSGRECQIKSKVQNRQSSVIPVETGIQNISLDPRLRGDDIQKCHFSHLGFSHLFEICHLDFGFTKNPPQ
jgi:hypothetical protein